MTFCMRLVLLLEIEGGKSADGLFVCFDGEIRRVCPPAACLKEGIVLAQLPDMQLMNSCRRARGRRAELLGLDSLH
jgi:hypothetical protein